MLKKMKTSTKVFLATVPLAFINVAILVYQFSNLVISPWNIIPTVLIVLIMVGNIINMLGIKLSGAMANLSQFGAPAPSDKEQNALRDNEDFYAINTSFPTRLTMASILWKTLFLIIFIVLTCFFAYKGSSIKYDQVVTGTVIEKHVMGSVETDVSSSGEVVSSDNRSLLMVVSYEVDGKMYKAEVRDQFSHNRRSAVIDLCVNNDGSFVCAYGKVVSFKIMAVASVVFAILTFLGFVFKLPNQYLVLLVMGILGVGIIAMFNFADWSNWLLKDFTLFGGCFVTLCVMCMIQLIALRIIHTIGRKRDSNFKLS